MCVLLPAEPEKGVVIVKRLCGGSSEGTVFSFPAWVESERVPILQQYLELYICILCTY